MKMNNRIIVAMLVLCLLPAALAQDNGSAAENGVQPGLVSASPTVEVVVETEMGEEVLEVPEVSEADLLEAEGVDADSGACTTEYAPVCGEDGSTYINACSAAENGVEVVVGYGGECDAEADEDTVLTPPAQLRAVDACETAFGARANAVAATIADHPRVAVAYLQDKVHGRRVLAGMDSVIAYGNESGVDVAELQGIRDRFQEAFDGLPDLSGDPVEYRPMLQEMRLMVREFHTAAHGLEGLQQNQDMVRQRVLAAQEAVDEELALAREEARQKSAEYSLDKFDYHVCKLKNSVNRYYNLGYDTANADAFFSELEALRPELEVALAAGDWETARSINLRASNAWGKARSQLLVKERARIRRVVGERVRSVENQLVAVSESGCDQEEVLALQKELEEFRSRVRMVETELYQGNRVGAEGFLLEARQELDDFRAKYREGMQAIRSECDVKPLTVRPAELVQKRAEVRALSRVRDVEGIDPDALTPSDVVRIRRLNAVKLTALQSFSEERLQRVRDVQQYRIQSVANISGERIQALRDIREARAVAVQQSTGAVNRVGQAGNGGGAE
ncbi:MAG: hypothetical protein JW834_03210 [Candidatus Diapherotrites archaeon]|nr:hypothetical protein [Candidatus Diapherotrites archaeon]